MSTHTPGPWKLSASSAASLAGSHFWDPIDIETPRGDVRVYQGAGRGREEQIANARLIAAAPVLLKACKLALPLLADLVARTAGEAREFGGSYSDRIAYDIVEAAITKAERGDTT